jgi:hypothetical protein
MGTVGWGEIVHWSFEFLPNLGPSEFRIPGAR